MVFLSKEEAEVRFFQHLKCQFRILFDIEAQCFQAVCRTAQGRGGSIAVFGYFNTSEAITMADVVEILKEWAPSPPVPTTSRTSMPG